MREMIGAPGVVGPGITNATHDMKLSGTHSDNPMGVNDSLRIKAWQTRKLAEALHCCDQETIDSAMSRNGSETRSSRIQQTGRTGVNELPSHNASRCTRRNNFRCDLRQDPKCRGLNMLRTQVFW